MAQANRSMADDVETIFLAANTEHFFLSSSIVKEIIGYGGNIDKMVPAYIRDELVTKFTGGL
jgi:pantetheine-phosphate adenylyltransferase